MLLKNRQSLKLKLVKPTGIPVDSTTREPMESRVQVYSVTVISNPGAKDAVSPMKVSTDTSAKPKGTSPDRIVSMPVNPN